ncbi:hypothetical protein Trydic_g9447 [Trypoxylus dichotomus]
MATFYANPNGEHDPWFEQAAFDGFGFRIWHVMFFCFSGFVSLAILVTCCVKIRVPRTTQEIEADYMRKKLADKFKERLMLIQNQDMDEIDLKRALEIIQDDYRMESKSIDQQLSIQLYPDYNVESENYSKNLKGEPQQSITKNLDTHPLAKSPNNGK